MVDKIKRDARLRMVGTGESYTEARRAVLHTTGEMIADADAATGEWTWQDAADRLDALAALLRHTDELQEHVMAARALRPPRAFTGWTSMCRVLRGDEWGARRGLVGAVDELVAAADPQPVERARRWHLRWYAEQAWALLAAAANGQPPAEIAPVLPVHEYDWEPAGWYPPADAAEISRRAGGHVFAVPVVDALAGISTALAASDDLADWGQSIADQHYENCDDLDYEADGRCHHSPGPAEHEIDAWSAVEEEAACYESALAAFCEATRILVRARATAPMATTSHA